MVLIFYHQLMVNHTNHLTECFFQQQNSLDSPMQDGRITNGTEKNLKLMCPVKVCEGECPKDCNFQT